LLLLVLAASSLAPPVAALDPAHRVYEYALQAWGAEEGLPQNTVEAIAQTRDGALWIGTQEGVVRFDGASFDAFNTRRMHALRSNHVNTLLETRDDRLWVGTFDGIVFHRGRDFSSSEALSIFDGQMVSCLAESRDGALWVGTAVGLARFDPEGRPEVVTYGSEHGLPSNAVRALAIDREGTVWIGTEGGLARHRAGRIESLVDRGRVAAGAVFAIAADGPGSVWIGGERGLARWDGRSFVAPRHRGGLADSTVRVLLLDREGALWVGREDGLARCFRGRWESLTPADGLSSAIVVALYEDREGTLWIGTETGGLNRLMEGTVVVHGRRAGLTDEVVYTVIGDGRDGLWLGTQNGQVEHLRPDKGELEHQRPLESLIGGVLIRSLLLDDERRLWVGSVKGLFRLANGKASRIPLLDLGRVPIRAVTQRPSGEMWIGTERHGILRGQPGRFTHIGADPDGGLPSDEIRAILEDSAGRLWIGTNAGLCEWQEPGCVTYTTRDGLPHNYVRALYADADGTLWIATYGGGLSRMRDGKFASYRAADGLPSDNVFWILEDGDGHLWLSCNRGIARISKKSLEDFAAGRLTQLRPTILGREDGMTSAECNGGNPGGWKTADGRLWFPTIRGLVEVSPSRITKSAVVPPTVLDEIVADGVSFPPSSPCVLPPGTRRVEFRYGAVSLRGSKRIQYRYRLEGFERSWVDAGTERRAPYPRLKPGRYTFRVKASNSDGVWDEVGTSCTLVVQAEVYQQPWFLPAIIVLLAGVLGAALALRMRAIADRERQLNRRIQEALTEIKVLSGLVPICSGCKNIRDDQGYWNRLEDYLKHHTEAEFSHGLCPECIRRLYPEYADVVLARGPSEEDQVAPGSGAPLEGGDAVPPVAADAEAEAEPVATGVREGVKALHERIARSKEQDDGAAGE
jgi:ligand-binding sensor domain-containing protein